jgi:glycine betaine/choline ABC-type transport system substrate-binding protein
MTAQERAVEIGSASLTVVREEVASEGLGLLLDSVTTTLTDENMRDMVGQVVNDKRDVADVAAEYLSGAGIL